MKKLKNNERKGITLIIVTSIMLVLSTTAVTFVRLSGYERTAASNYASAIDAKLTAYAGVDHALALIYDNIRTGGRIGLGEIVNGTNLQYPVNSERDLFQASRRLATRPGNDDPQPVSLNLNIDLFDDGNNDDDYSVSGLVGRNIGGDIIGTNELNGNFYSLKLEDSSGKINVNSFVGITVDPVTKVATVINDNNVQLQNVVILERILTTLSELAFTANQAIGTAAVQAIINQPLVNGRRFESMTELEDHLNVNVAGFATSGVQADRFLSNLTTTSPISTDTFAVQANRFLNPRDLPNYTSQSRAPVNINTASIDVLTALIENIRGRALFFVNDVLPDDDPIFDNNAIEVETTLRHEIIQYEIAIPRAEAQAIAQEIINRRGGGNPFLDQGEIDEFINAQNINVPTPPIGNPNGANAAINAGFIIGATRFTATDIVVSDVAWQQAFRDMLRSNFNGNVIDNYWNPNAGAYRRVSSADLVRIEDPGTGPIMIPSHTTELAAFSVGSVEITSVGRVTAQRGNLVTGVSIIETVADFGDTITHTTQQDFEGNAGTNPLVDVMTSPNNVIQQRIRNVTNFDSFAGAVEPRPDVDLNTADVSSALFFSGETFASPAAINVNDKTSKFDFANPFNLGVFDAGVISSQPNLMFNDNGDVVYRAPEQWRNPVVNSTAKKITYESSGGLTTGFPKLMAASDNVRNSNNNNLAYDGIVSRRLFYSPNLLDNARLKESFERYLIDTAVENFFNVGNTVNSFLTNRPVNATPDLRSNTLPSSANMGNVRGSLQFWVKFDADRNDTRDGNGSVACGLVGATTASGFRNGRDFLTEDTDFREGTQTYVYVNGLGELRVSRLYYALCFKLDEARPYGVFFDRDIDVSNRAEPRRDIIFKTAPFQAHEWYHIRVRWNDAQSGDSSIDLFVNDERVTASNAVAPIEIVDEDPFNNEYCLLNEKEPLDTLFINGFARPQARQGGYFHFSTDIHFPGNATIDQFITSTSETFSNSTFGSRRRYKLKSQFRNSAPGGQAGDLIAAVRWTSYPPYRESFGSDNDIDAAVTPQVRLFSVGINGQPANTGTANVGQDRILTEGGQLREIAILGQGGILPANNNVSDGQPLEYIFEFLSPRPKQLGGNTNAPLQGGRCATLDSVTVVVLKKYPLLRDTIIQ